MDIDREKLAELARTHGIRLAVLHGSAARGEMHAHSDVDVAVLLDEDPAGDRLLRLHADLPAIVPGRRLDLAVLNHADPLFLWHAVREARLLHGDPVELAELQCRAFRQYQDHRRYLELERTYAAELVERYAL